MRKAAVSFAAVALIASCQAVDVEALPRGKNAQWGTYRALTVDTIPGLKAKKEPPTDKYGGWKVSFGFKPTGFFTTAKRDGRWWIVDPLGNPFIAKSVSCFSRGRSERQMKVLREKFGSDENWASREQDYLRSLGFNSIACWSDVSVSQSVSNRLPYMVFFSPIGSYNRVLAKSGKEEAGVAQSDYTHTPYRIPYVFDAEFDALVDRQLKKASDHAQDPYLIGYFIDNELPWLNTALKTALVKIPPEHRLHQEAQRWLDKAKGRTGCTFLDITDDDGKRFAAYCCETYLRKVSAALRKYDPNHMFLGSRFCRWDHELTNDYLMQVAGKYMDIVSINHYSKWNPEMKDMQRWECLSGKPFMVTEFYVKGEDSGLPNKTGVGWIVRTQNDRGLFYENFISHLMWSGTSVGWNWFKYQDNDPTDLKTDPSNRDSNKGIVTWNYERYEPLAEHMKAINTRIYGLTQLKKRK